MYTQRTTVSACRAGVRDVVHGYARLADLLLQPLAHTAARLEQVAGAHHVHVGDRDATVSEPRQRGLRTEIDQVLVGVAPNLVMCVPMIQTSRSAI